MPEKVRQVRVVLAELNDILYNYDLDIEHAKFMISKLK
jgi:hypothetical protein